MNDLTVAEPIAVDTIRSRILTIRGVQVMLDRDLAELYGVPTKRLNEQVKRNARRFPDNFMFQLTKEELEDWRSQIATSNVGDGFVLYQNSDAGISQNVAPGFIPTSSAPPETTTSTWDLLYHDVLCPRHGRMSGGKAERIVPPVDFHLHLEYATECTDYSAQRTDSHVVVALLRCVGRLRDAKPCYHSHTMPLVFDKSARNLSRNSSRITCSVYGSDAR